MSIANWPAGERPREKLLLRGVEALSDAELLAIFLRTGTAGKSAVDIGRELLERFGSLTALCAASESDLCVQRGVGQSKYVQLQASMEIARRALKERLASGNVLGSPTEVRNFLRLTLQALPYEAFVALFLDSQNRVLQVEELFRGTLTQTSVYPREVVKRTLTHNAGGVIFAHNHPSGVAEPSNADKVLTEALVQALRLIDVRVLDHFIVAGSNVISFAERGLI